LEILEARDVPSTAASINLIPAIRPISPPTVIAGSASLAPSLIAPALERSSASQNVLDVRFWAGRASVGGNVPITVYNSQGQRVLSLTTNRDGKAVFNQLPPGSYRVVADFRVNGQRYFGFYDLDRRVSHPIWVQRVVVPEGTRPVNGMNSITVTVLDRTGSRPIPGARVRLLDANRRVVAEYRANSAGQVDFWQLSEQRYYVEALDLTTNRWVAPAGEAFRDFQTTGRIHWSPLIRLTR
jgi:hypothetical protein